MSGYDPRRAPAESRLMTPADVADAAKRKRARSLSAYYRLKAEGLCPSCRGEAPTGKVYCKACVLARNNEEALVKGRRCSQCGEVGHACSSCPRRVA